MEATKSFSASPEEVARARAFVRTFAAQASAAAAVADLELLTSELVTNALLYGNGPIEVQAINRRGRNVVCHIRVAPLRRSEQVVGAILLVDTVPVDSTT
jgi:anti-sigma regulatory factor (Ser/Thr protein kinase)